MAHALKTVEDLSVADDERLELLNGELIKRPMARFEHALAQSCLSDEVAVLKRKSGVGGWWIITEISVQYNEHQCPSHDLAGWRKERLPQQPSGVMQLAPDWACEILSPGHEKKDLLHNFMLLQSQKVPFYWVISPEDQTLIAYQLEDDAYKVVFSKNCQSLDCQMPVSIPPFTEVPIHLTYLFGTA